MATLTDVAVSPSLKSRPASSGGIDGSRAYAAARDIYDMRSFWTAVGGLDNEVGAAAGALDQVVVEVARVAVQVLVRPELRGVDEDGDDDIIVFGAGAFDEGGVAGVQRAHRRHEADRLPLRPCGPHGGTEFVFG